MTTTVAPLVAVGAVADALDAWLAARGVRTTYWSISRGSMGTTTVAFHSRRTVAPETLVEMGLHFSWYFMSSGTVHERWHTELTSTTGASWCVEAIIEAGPASEYGHLLDDDAEEDEG